MMRKTYGKEIFPLHIAHRQWAICKRQRVLVHNYSLMSLRSFCNSATALLILSLFC